MDAPASNSTRIFIVLIPIAVLMVAGGAWFSRHTKSPRIPPNWRTPDVQHPAGRSAPSPTSEAFTAPPSAVPESATPKQNEEAVTIVLGKHDFARDVEECFRGNPCELGDNAWALYREFKTAGRSHDADLLISFLRSKLGDADWKKKYRKTVQRMIDDFYSPEEREFQKAAYHNYLGENEKSLELYLDLERKTRTHPELRPPPKLNIANVYYDLGKKSEALAYYKAALNDLNLGRAEAYPLRGTMDFVQTRIDELESSNRN